ncbi:nuclear pore complex protein Nup214 isoform X2 [Bufo bufo]|uniref:nuclear pore complex protein Nup214 isoform X2 n=1 Tax=Bufo bufo TaxID=8384 RepID=UPI001ABE9CB8|nr:nuclear pore complex protein Nup214 isoform X2 [Bufo bufo]
MEDDTDVPQERETKDFQFRQLKKKRIFPVPPDLPKERSNLLAVSNKYGFLFAGGPTGLKIFRTDDVLVPINPGEDPNKIEEAPPGIEVPTRHRVHHVALSSDNLTLSVCTSSADCGSSVAFYDIRTLVGESKQPKEAFTSQPLSRDPGSFVTDLKWNPVVSNMVAVCLSDGSISVFQVTDAVLLYASLPASLGVTCVCWSPKGKQLAVGKQNGTVVQYVPTLEERKVIPCPPFYESDPVKVLDILWVSTYVFAVVYAAADGSLETSPQLVMVLIPKKEDRRGERFLNFTETCYSSCNERQHHFFMNYIDDWNVLLGASAASIEVSVIARPPDQSLWELWLLEDSSRAELPVTDNSEDTLPMGVVVSYTSQLSVFISEEKILPPTPILLLLSTDGVLCPFHMINSIEGSKSLTVIPERIPAAGERLVKAAASFSATPGPAVVNPSPLGAVSGNATNASFAGLPGKSTAPAFGLPINPPAPAFTVPAANVSVKSPAAAPAFPLPAATGSTKPSAAAFSFSATLHGKPQSTSAFTLSSSSLPNNPQTAPFGFGMPANFSFNPQDSSFAGRPQSSPAFSVPSASLPVPAPSSSFSALFGATVGAPSFHKPPGAPVSSFTSELPGGAFGAATSNSENSGSSTQAAESGAQPAPPSVRVNLKDKFGAVDSAQPKPSFAPSAQGFSFAPPAKTTTPTAQGGNVPMSAPSQSTGTHSRPFSDVSQSGQSAPPQPAMAQKTARVLPGAAKQAPPQPVVSGSFDKSVDSKDPIHNGIKEEIAHFQKELDDLKARTAKACFPVGSPDEMRQLRTECDDLHSFLLEIQETTKSHHGDIGCLKTTVLEGLANAESALEQKERLSDPVYRRLLYKKPLDPKSEAQMQEIRRLHQYVRNEVQGVSDVLDLEWDRFVESERKQKGYAVSDRETLFNTLANNREIINQQRQRLNQLMDSLYHLRLYNCTSKWKVTSDESSYCSHDVEIESLQDTLSKTMIDTTIKLAPKLPPKLSPVKQNQLRNFLTKRKVPPVRSLAPANLCRSSFLNPSFIEDLDDVSSSSSLSEAADTQGGLSEPQHEPVRQETPPPEPSPVRAVRHAPVTRTVSLQPGFATPASLLGKVQPSSGPFTSTPMVSVSSMSVIPQGADSTMLATKTVKHGAPTVPATQAAAAAAMRRQQVTGLAPAALTESTLQTVPKVVNVKELKGNGPGPNIQLVMAPTNPQSVAQASNQANKAAAVQAKQVPPSAGLKVAQAPSSAPQPGPALPPSRVMGPAAPSSSNMAAGAPGNKVFPFSSPSLFSTSPAIAAATTSAPTSTFGSFAPGKESHQPPGFPGAPGIKAPFASGSETSIPFLSCLPPSSSVEPISAVKPGTAAPHLQHRDTTQPANFMSVGGMKQQLVSPPNMSPSILSVMPPSLAPADSSTSAKPASLQVAITTSAATSPAGETLGSFSGLRVGQVEDVYKAAPSAPQGVGSMVSSSKPGDPASTAGASSVLNVPLLAGIFNPGVKSGFSFMAPAGSAPPASGAPSAVPASVVFGFMPPITATQTPAAPIPVPSPAPGAFSLDVKQAAGPEKAVPDYFAAPQLQALLAQPSEGGKEAAPSPAGDGTVSTPVAAASITAADPKTLTVPVSTFPATVNLGQNAATTSTPAVVSTSLPSPALVPAASSGAPSTQVPSGEGTPTPAPAFVQPPASAAPPVFGQNPATGSAPLLFGQQSSTSATTSESTAPASAFGSSGFGVTEGSAGFGQPAFGQAGSFWQTSPTSANGFSFKPSNFSSQLIFSQTPTSTAAGSSSGGGLFGSSATTSSANAFSFGQQSSSSTPTAEGGLFGQSSAAAFGQGPSTFGQATPAFGSAGSSATTTTSSSVFGFVQSAGFPSSSSGSIFGQSQNTGPSLFAQSSSSSGSLFGASSGASGSGGFFSGLGGKPSQEAANKNPFGSPGAAFGAPGSSSGFGAAPVFGSPPTFGGSPGFGGTPTFGTAQSFSSPLGSTGGRVFGEGTAAATTGGFGFGSGGSSFGSMATQSAPSFGVLSQQGTGFGSQGSGFGFGPGSSVPAPASSGGFSFGATNQSSSAFGGGWRG